MCKVSQEVVQPEAALFLCCSTIVWLSTHPKGSNSTMLWEVRLPIRDVCSQGQRGMAGRHASVGDDVMAAYGGYGSGGYGSGGYGGGGTVNGGQPWQLPPHTLPLPATHAGTEILAGLPVSAGGKRISVGSQGLSSWGTAPLTRNSGT